jgi:hypothetical protein
VRQRWRRTAPRLTHNPIVPVEANASQYTVILTHLRSVSAAWLSQCRNKWMHMPYNSTAAHGLACRISTSASARASASMRASTGRARDVYGTVQYLVEEIGHGMTTRGARIVDE